MKIFVLVIVSFAVCGSACNAKSFEASEKNRMVMALKEDTMLGPRPPYWQPQVDQAKAFEAKLELYLTKIDAQDIAYPLSDYRFQYTGIGSNKIFIAVNGFCKESWSQFPNWKEKWVLVLDGGSCFFEATFDSKKNEIIQFMFHNAP